MLELLDMAVAVKKKGNILRRTRSGKSFSGELPVDVRLFSLFSKSLREVGFLVLTVAFATDHSIRRARFRQQLQTLNDYASHQQFARNQEIGSLG
jgi:hypothetical protein